MHDHLDENRLANMRAELDRMRERETATREILNVMSQSREDEAKVFDLILQKAASLCDADQAGLQLVNESRSHFRLAADLGQKRTAFELGKEWSLDSYLSSAVAIRSGEVVHIPDYAETDLYKQGDPTAVHTVDTEGTRSRLVVPLLQNGIAIGSISLSRHEVRSFEPSEIALVETFAAQAVNAIENTKQFAELQNRLEREEATRQVLQVISQSRDDEQPVFDAILENACRLCEAPLAYLSMVTEDGTEVISPAHRGAFASFAEGLGRLRVPLRTSKLALARAINEARPFREDDISDSDLYRSGEPNRVSMVEQEGGRSLLVVPMVKDGRGIGSITLYRREVQPFSDDDVLMVESFAAQAVIAIENVRQFRELQHKTNEVQVLNASLEKRVMEQVDEIERMGRLKNFLPAAVADTVVSSGSEKMLSSHRALLGVLFSDIRGFTAFCETAEPEETIEVLQTYHQEMGKLINAHAAGVDHRMGDGIMVLFNDPIACDDPAENAVRLAIAMRARMAELGKDWKRMGFRLGFGVGVSLGYATVGMVGYEGRSDYTASGTAINVASRLCEMAQDGEILLSARAAIAVEDDFQSVSTGEITLKGIREPVEVFRLVECGEA